MMTVVVEHVAHGVRDFASRPQSVRVVAVDQHVAVPSRERIEPFCQPDAKTLHAPGERGCIFSLDDQMQVHALDRVVHDADAEAIAGLAQNLLDGTRTAVRAEVTQSRHEPDRDVDWMTR